MDSESKKQDDKTLKFVDLMTNSQRNLHSFILALLSTPEDVDDIMQETNRIMWSKREEYQHGTNFYAWMFKIARFQILANQKKKSRERHVFDDSLLDIMSREFAQRQECQSLRHRRLHYCLEKLNNKDRNLIQLRYHDALRINKISSIIGRTATATRQALFRIRKALRQCIDQTADSGEA